MCVAVEGVRTVENSSGQRLNTNGGGCRRGGLAREAQTPPPPAPPAPD